MIKKNKHKEKINKNLNKYKKLIGTYKEKKPDKIQRKCEDSLLIFTATNKYSELLKDFIISLRNNGKFNGRLLILDYGMEEYDDKLFKFYNVELIKLKPKNKDEVVILRYIDIIKILEKSKENYVAHFDNDIWFQNKIKPLIPILSRTNGILMAPDAHRFYMKNISKNEDLSNEYFKNIHPLIKKHNATLNAGFIAGYKKEFIKKMKIYLKCFKENKFDYNWGVDQYILNLIFDHDNDSSDGYLFNTTPRCITIVNNLMYSNKTLKPLIGIHLVGKYKRNKNLRLKF